MLKARPYVVCIAGFDPTAGAGLTADIKTIESHKAYGLSACSAITWQSEEEFKRIQWLPIEEIIEQLDLMKHFDIKVAKIGIMPNAKSIHTLVDYLSETFPEIKIIWDPVLGSSTGKALLDMNTEEYESIVRKVYLNTPNMYEIKMLYPTINQQDACLKVSKFGRVFLKGGHSDDKIGKDFLFEDGKVKAYNPKPGRYFPKHGSGCVISSAIASNLAYDRDLHKSILRSKRYVERLLASNHSLLGWHKM